MSVLIALHPATDADAFLREVRAAGVDLRPIRGLPGHFVAPRLAPEDFPLAGHPDIAALEDGDTEAHGEAAQPISIGVSMEGGSWAIARHIRRDAPWRAGSRLRHPIETSFRCARTGAGVDVYVVDSGIRYDHQEFAGPSGSRATFVGGTYGSGGVDDEGHGTSVAGCIAGATVGIARGASLRIVKGLDSANAGTLTNIATSIGIVRDDYLARAATGRPAILNLSLSADGATVGSAVAACIDAGIVVVASAANGRSDSVPIPGATTDVICVGGIKANDTPYYTGNFGTNFGPRVDLLAASERVWTASRTAPDAFRIASGTSFGAPLVAGALACMLQGRARLTGRTQVQAVREALIARATVGRFVPQPQFGIGALPDRILWLDPDALTETIPGLP